MISTLQQEWTIYTPVKNLPEKAVTAELLFCWFPEQLSHAPSDEALPQKVSSLLTEFAD